MEKRNHIKIMNLFILESLSNFNYLDYQIQVEPNPFFVVKSSKSQLSIIGECLYTYYSSVFLLGGINLFIAMIGVIYLIILNYPIRKMQSIIIQSNVKKIKNKKIHFFLFFRTSDYDELDTSFQSLFNFKWNNVKLFYFKNKQQNYTYRK